MLFAFRQEIFLKFKSCYFGQRRKLTVNTLFTREHGMKQIGLADVNRGRNYIFLFLMLSNVHNVTPVNLNCIILWGKAVVTNFSTPLWKLLLIILTGERLHFFSFFL